MQMMLYFTVYQKKTTINATIETWRMKQADRLNNVMKLSKSDQMIPGYNVHIALLSYMGRFYL